MGPLMPMGSPMPGGQAGADDAMTPDVRARLVQLLQGPGAAPGMGLPAGPEAAPGMPTPPIGPGPGTGPLAYVPPSTPTRTRG